ncbi:hypothetical protein L9X50_16225 [Vibrio aestuarianus]|uniref:hypothetical protein n=1 Tax=Vibrio aestuarianus TaxID=28171 RepID=UPI0021C28A99|nr:hypothetical protein [Vibrio aestuarianus]MDE1319544.1 hypothetical protein [Vibrio aestuarianus]CAH8242276.1 conserved hypothetical protein [Vibrio aestuarianus]
MLDNISNATALGKTLHGEIGNLYDNDPKTGFNGLAVGEAAYDLGTGILDSTPLGQVIDIPVELIEGGFGKVEKTKVVEGIKQKFHVYLSQKTSNAVSSFTTPNVLMQDRRKLLKGKRGQDWLAGAEQIYNKHQGERFYKMQRKMQDKARVLKKNPIQLAKVPLSVVPLGEIAKFAIKGGEYAIGKFAGARKARKQKEYTNAGNRQMLEAKLGKQEYNRKKAKWQAKDIAELGPKIQRNLYKLKQSVEILNSRKQHLNLCSAKYAQDPTNVANLRALTKSREDAAMSMYEVKHYVEKISGMCKCMEETAFTITAYMEGLNQITDMSESDIMKTF